MSDRNLNIADVIESYKRSIEDGRTPIPLTKLVNCDKLARTIAGDIGLFDTKTRRFLAEHKRNKTLASYLKKKTLAVSVFLGVDEAPIKDAFTKLGLSYLDGVDMISVGDSIYVYAQELRREPDGSINAATAALLGHELIHSIQADAFGGEAGFAAAYAAAGHYTSNEFEIAAYRFGGKAPDAMLEQYSIAAPVLRDGEWWRLA